MDVANLDDYGNINEEHDWDGDSLMIQNNEQGSGTGSASEPQTPEGMSYSNYKLSKTKKERVEPQTPDGMFLRPNKIKKDKTHQPRPSYDQNMPFDYDQAPNFRNQKTRGEKKVGLM